MEFSSSFSDWLLLQNRFIVLFWWRRIACLLQDNSGNEKPRIVRMKRILRLRRQSDNGSTWHHVNVKGGAAGVEEDGESEEDEASGAVSD